MCHDSDYFKEAALAVYNHCNCSDFVNAANTAVDNCKNVGAPPAMMADELIAYVSGSTNCSSEQNDLSMGSTNAAEHSHNNNSSKGNQIALGVDLGLDLPTILIGAFALYFQYRASNRKRSELLAQKDFSSG